MLGQIPTIHLIDPQADASPFGRSVAQLPLAKGSLLGGVYAYLEHENRLVAVDGNRQLVRISHVQNPDGTWRLELSDVIDLSGAAAADDNVTGLAPSALSAPTESLTRSTSPKANKFRTVFPPRPWERPSQPHTRCIN